MLSGNRSRQPRNAPEQLFIPLRRFRPECLLTRDGDSVLERLLDGCSVVVVQDADMRPEDLVAHRDSIASPGIVAIDTTKELGLKGHFSYALGRADDRSLIALAGERLW